MPEDMAETAEIARITGDYEFFRKASGSQKIMQSIIWKRQIQISRKNTGLFLFESAGGFRLMWEPVSPFEPLSGKSGYDDRQGGFFACLGRFEKETAEWLGKQAWRAGGNGCQGGKWQGRIVCRLKGGWL